MENETESIKGKNFVCKGEFLSKAQTPLVFSEKSVFLVKKLNKWVVRGTPNRNIMTRSDPVHLRVVGLVSSMPDAAQPAYANWRS